MTKLIADAHGAIDAGEHSTADACTESGIDVGGIERRFSVAITIGGEQVVSVIQNVEQTEARGVSLQVDVEGVVVVVRPIIAECAGERITLDHRVVKIERGAVVPGGSAQV